jgi:hypothetical protein
MSTLPSEDEDDNMYYGVLGTKFSWSNGDTVSLFQATGLT